MTSDTRLNAVTLVGLGIIAATGAMSLLKAVSVDVLVLQATVPIVIGVGLVAYRWVRADSVVATNQWTVLQWTLVGLLTFTMLGFWFGEMASRADTALSLSITGSLTVGAALGTILGVYAAQIHRTNAVLAETVAELEQTNDRLAMKNKQLDQFVDVASHDLRNPMNIAKGRLELAREEVDNEHLQKVDTALTRMETLITDLVSLARSGKQIDEVDPVALGEVSRLAWGSVDTKAASLTVATDIQIYADESRLRQLFENLFRNAVQHGGEDVTVTVGAQTEGFYVADTGAGIPDALRGQVLDQGVTTADEGVGLGLTIVKQIAHAHGWEILVGESDAGGARFEFSGVEFSR